MFLTDEQLILAIDTSGPKLQLGLFAERQKDVLVEELTTGHAEILFDRLAGFLDSNGAAYRDLTRVGVTTGPGSFTGLRIAIAAARGLGLALKIPVIGVPNLLALSLGGPENPHVVVVDARRNEAYVQKFLAPGHPETGAQLLSLNQVEELSAAGKYLILKDPALDIGRVAKFAAVARQQDFPPEPLYVRAADAKPQNKMQVARK